MKILKGNLLKRCIYLYMGNMQPLNGSCFVLFFLTILRMLLLRDEVLSKIFLNEKMKQENEKMLRILLLFVAFCFRMCMT